MDRKTNGSYSNFQTFDLVTQNRRIPYHITICLYWWTCGRTNVRTRKLQTHLKIEFAWEGRASDSVTWSTFLNSMEKQTELGLKVKKVFRLQMRSGNLLPLLCFSISVCFNNMIYILLSKRSQEKPQKVPLQKRSLPEIVLISVFMMYNRRIDERKDQWSDKPSHSYRRRY